MSIEIGGMPSGIESVPELFEVDNYDQLAAESWNEDISDERQATAELLCLCCNRDVCDPNYKYI